jgi:hypothetical protein
MNISVIIYISVTIIIFVLIFLFFKSSKDKYNRFKFYDNDNNVINSVYDINNYGNENDRSLKNRKYRRIHGNKKYNYYKNNDLLS